MRKVIGNSQYQKIANALLILRLLRQGSNTRVALSRTLGLQPSTVTYIVNRLLEAGLILETQKNERSETKKAQSSGRKAVCLELNTGFGRIIGLELLADSGWGTILDPKGNILHSQRIEYPEITSADPRKRFQHIVASSVEQMNNLCDGIDILGIGIALPGIVTSHNHTVRECWTHALRDCDFSRFFKQTFDCPVFLENDANCCVQRYLFEHDEEQNDNLMYLLARTYPAHHVPEGVSPFGIGFGMVFNGQLYRGSSSRAGEFRSAMLEHGNEERQLAFELKSMDDFHSSKGIREEIFKEILANMETISSVVDPATIYLGGFLLDYEDEVHDLLWPIAEEKIIFANAHTDASEGAAMNVLAHMFSIPQIGSESVHWPWESLLSITM